MNVSKSNPLKTLLTISLWIIVSIIIFWVPPILFDVKEDGVVILLACSFVSAVWGFCYSWRKVFYILMLPLTACLYDLYEFGFIFFLVKPWSYAFLFLFCLCWCVISYVLGRGIARLLKAKQSC